MTTTAKALNPLINTAPDDLQDGAKTALAFARLLNEARILLRDARPLASHDFEKRCREQVGPIVDTAADSQTTALPPGIVLDKWPTTKTLDFECTHSRVAALLGRPDLEEWERQLIRTVLHDVSQLLYSSPHATIGGMRFIVVDDPHMPPNQLEIRDRHGKVTRIVNLDPST